MSTINLGAIPTNLAEVLQNEYLQIKSRYSLNDWGPSQLKGGRFAEAVLRIFQHLLGSPVTPLGTDIPAPEKTRVLNAVQIHPNLDEHIRQKAVSLTRLLLDFRNSRDSAHLGGFDANSMDTLFVLTAATWIFCELVRVYGGYSMPDAQSMIDGLAVKEYPIIMEFEGETFITRYDLTARQEVLVLLNKYPKANFDFLFSKTGDSNKTRFQKTLETMIGEKLIGEKEKSYFLMPRGADTIRSESLLSYS